MGELYLNQVYKVIIFNMLERGELWLCVTVKYKDLHIRRRWRLIFWDTCVSGTYLHCPLLIFFVLI